jgi:hypothetical protein
MSVDLPFLTSYDPPGTSEGSLDPLGLYQIADQLAVQLVPGVRERMQRVRFLTAMAVGALVTGGLEDDPRKRDASPYLIWEWLVVESLVRNVVGDGRLARSMTGDEAEIGVPGTRVTRRALEGHGYLDARSYLKTPRIFGFHGVYKRLAIHLGIIDVHLDRGPNLEPLVDVWARDRGFDGISGAKPLLSNWSSAVRRSLNRDDPTTDIGLTRFGWSELAEAFAPSTAGRREKRFLRQVLTGTDRMGAFPQLWELQEKFGAEYSEERLHDHLKRREPEFGPLLGAIRTYEAFARSMQDAFDTLKAAASRSDTQGFHLEQVPAERDFEKCNAGLHERFEKAHRALGELAVNGTSLQNFFAERFAPFAEPLDARACATALCDHHERIQRAKSAEGKRAWFDRLGPDRIYIRHAYRDAPRPILPGRYLHGYRGRPVRNFWIDLT